LSPGPSPAAGRGNRFHIAKSPELAYPDAKSGNQVLPMAKNQTMIRKSEHVADEKK
jgi:hypothetical protein